MANLASDLNNPEFVGAMNPDELLHVEFYYHEPVDKWASDAASYEQGKKVVIKRPKQPFVRIMKPGDKNSVMEVAVREEHKRRWPAKWMYFQINEGLIDDGKNIPGWKVEEWPHLQDKPDLLRELKFGRYHTVEQIAGASDEQVQKMGIGGLGLRQQARVDLRGKIGLDIKAEMDAKDKVISEMQTQMAALTEIVKGMVKPKDVVIEAKADVAQVTHYEQPEVKPEVQPVVMKRKGRPKGSKNKPKQT